MTKLVRVLAKLKAVTAPALATFDGYVDCNAPGIRLGMFHQPNARPSTGHLEQALLDKILGEGKIPNDQIGSPKQISV
jgi:hypothetical protein